MVVKVQEEGQEGLDRSACHCSLMSYHTSEVLPLTVDILLAHGKGQVMEQSCQGQAFKAKLHYVCNSACMENCCSSICTF